VGPSSPSASWLVAEAAARAGSAGFSSRRTNVNAPVIVICEFDGGNQMLSIAAQFHCDGMQPTNSASTLEPLPVVD
jgi:hypothetical protein